MRKTPLLKHFTAVINEVWISTSIRLSIFRNPVRSGSECCAHQRTDDRMLRDAIVFKP